MKGSLLQPSSNHKRKKVNENDQSKIFELLLLSVLILLVCFYPICQAILSDNLFNFIELDGSKSKCCVKVDTYEIFIYSTDACVYASIRQRFTHCTRKGYWLAQERT